MNTLRAIKGSLIAGFAVAALALFSMGLLGMGLYYACYPLLAPFYGNLNDWRGDDVWPATLWAGMLWALCFPVAGFVGLRLKQAGKPSALRLLCWLAILWLGAALVWFYVASTSSYIRFNGPGVGLRIEGLEEGAPADKPVSKRDENPSPNGAPP